MVVGHNGFCGGRDAAAGSAITHDSGYYKHSISSHLQSQLATQNPNAQEEKQQIRTIYEKLKGDERAGI